MKTVGDYEYDEKDELGRGAFGTVYRGHKKTKLDEVVAIKEVRLIGPTSDDPKINREAEILRALSNKRHENIVTLFLCHSETQTRHMYFIMEFCNGGCLRKYLKRNQQLDDYTSVAFLKQIAAGLQVAHDMHIIHRDLKPENILLCFTGLNYPSPDNITLKIADFGIGRFLHSDDMATTICGSLPYTAPEILMRRPGGHDHRVDLWSLGVIAYEFIAGSLPKDIIALNGYQMPANATEEYADILRGLLENDENKRFTLKHVLDYQFLGSTIRVAVFVPGEELKMITVNENQTVDHLFEIIRDKFQIKTTQDLCLVQDDGERFEIGSGKSIHDSGIGHCSILHICRLMRGGNWMD